jgi:murein DD-endopeptidase MepM/ murein hydrolase activator NlpD
MLQKADHHRPIREKHHDAGTLPRPIICAGSFFRARKTRRPAIFSLAVALAFLLVGMTTQGARVTYAVYVNGEAVGEAPSVREAESAVGSAQTRLREIFGADYTLEGAVALIPAQPDAAASDDAAALEDAILAGVPGVERLYVLSVNGEVIGASEDNTALRALLDDALAAYRTANTVKIGFCDDVTIERTYIGGDVSRSFTSMGARLRVMADVKRLDEVLYVTEIPFATEYVADDTLYEGDTRVLTEGVDGRQTVVQRTEYRGGEARSTDFAKITVNLEPVTQIVAAGTVPRPPTASYGEFIWPLERVVVTSKFGPRSISGGSSNHQGIDLDGTKGTSIYAADGGEVIFAETYSGYGNLVQILHDNGDITWYGHCNKLLVTAGERVARGQTVAEMGATGAAVGVHLHFEVHPNGGGPVNPLPYLPPQ